MPDLMIIFCPTKSGDKSIEAVQHCGVGSCGYHPYLSEQGIVAGIDIKLVGLIGHGAEIIVFARIAHLDNVYFRGEVGVD